MFRKSVMAAAMLASGLAVCGQASADTQFDYSNVTVGYFRTEIGPDPVLKMNGMNVELNKEIQNQIYVKAGLAHSIIDQEFTEDPVVIDFKGSETDLMLGFGRYFTLGTAADAYLEAGVVRASATVDVELRDTSDNSYGKETATETETIGIFGAGLRIALVPGKLEFNPSYSYVDEDAGAVKYLGAKLRFQANEKLFIGASIKNAGSEDRKIVGLDLSVKI